MIQYYNNNKNKDEVPSGLTKFKNGFHLINDPDYCYYWVNMEDLKLKSDDDYIEIYGYINNRFMKVIGTNKRETIKQFERGEWQLINN